MKIYIIALCLLITTAFAECDHLIDHGKVVHAICYPTERTAKNVKNAMFVYEYGYNSKETMQVTEVVHFKDDTRENITWTSMVYGGTKIVHRYFDKLERLSDIRYDESTISMIDLVNETKAIYE